MRSSSALVLVLSFFFGVNAFSATGDWWCSVVNQSGGYVSSVSVEWRPAKDDHSVFGSWSYSVHNIGMTTGTTNTSYRNYTGAGYHIEWRVTLPSGGGVIYEGVNGGTVWVYCSGVPTNYCSKVCVQNSSAVYQTFVLLIDGVQSGVYWGVDAGQNGCKEFCTDSTNHVFSVRPLTGYSGVDALADGSIYFNDPVYGSAVNSPLAAWVPNDGSPGSTSSGVFTGSGAGPGGTSPFSTSYTNAIGTNGLPTNGPIVFNATNTAPATDGSLQIGLNAVRDAIVGGNAQLHSDLLSVNSSVQSGSAGVSGAVWNASASVTGAVWGAAGLSTGYLAHIDNSMSNLLNVVTNRSTNFPPELVTDSSSALAKAHSGIDGAVGELDSLTTVATGIQGVSGGIGDGAGAGDSGWQVTLGDHTFDFSPTQHGFGVVFDVARSLFKWLLIGAYVKVVIGDCQKAVNVLVSMEGTKVSNIDMAGFNALGLAVWPTIVVAVLVLWGVGIGLVVGQFNSLSLFWDYITGTNPLAIGDPRGIALALRCFPFDVMVGLVGSYVLFRISLTKAMLVTMAAIKWLAGA